MKVCLTPRGANRFCAFPLNLLVCFSCFSWLILELLTGNLRTALQKAVCPRIFSLSTRQVLTTDECVTKTSKTNTFFKQPERVMTGRFLKPDLNLSASG